MKAEIHFGSSIIFEQPQVTPFVNVQPSAASFLRIPLLDCLSLFPVMGSKGKSDWDNARSKTTYTPNRAKQYQCCTKFGCKGWEWCSNHRTNCRICKSQLEPPNVEYDRQKQQARKNSRGKSPRSPHPRRENQRDRFPEGVLDSSASSDPNAGLPPLFQARLPELRAQFPIVAEI